MKKLLCLIFISIFLFSCKSNENPKPTLSERAGTYEGGGFTLVIKSNGEVQVVDTQKLSYKATLDQASTETSFEIDNFKIDFSNGVKIDTAELTKKSDSEVFLLTLKERAGTYIGVVTVTVASSGNITFATAGTINFDPNSTDTRFDYNANAYIVFLDANSLNITSSGTTEKCTK